MDLSPFITYGKPTVPNKNSPHDKTIHPASLEDGSLGYPILAPFIPTRDTLKKSATEVSYRKDCVF